MFEDLGKRGAWAGAACPRCHHRYRLRRRSSVVRQENSSSLRSWETVGREIGNRPSFLRIGTMRFCVSFVQLVQFVQVFVIFFFLGGQQVLYTASRGRGAYHLSQPQHPKIHTTGHAP